MKKIKYFIVAALALTVTAFAVFTAPPTRNNAYADGLEPLTYNVYNQAEIIIPSYITKNDVVYDVRDNTHYQFIIYGRTIFPEEGPVYAQAWFNSISSYDANDVLIDQINFNSSFGLGSANNVRDTLALSYANGVVDIIFTERVCFMYLGGSSAFWRVTTLTGGQKGFYLPMSSNPKNNGQLQYSNRELPSEYSESYKTAMQNANFVLVNNAEYSGLIVYGDGLYDQSKSDSENISFFKNSLSDQVITYEVETPRIVTISTNLYSAGLLTSVGGKWSYALLQPPNGLQNGYVSPDTEIFLYGEAHDENDPIEPEVSDPVTITYKYHSNTYTRTFESGETLTFPVLEVQPGEEITSWKIEGTDTIVDNSTIVTEDLTLCANTRTNSVIVSFNYDGVPGQIVAYGYTVQEPDPPTKEGYTFTGWYKDDQLNQKFNFTTDTVTENITLYPGFIRVEQQQTTSDTPAVEAGVNNLFESIGLTGLTFGVQIIIIIGVIILIIVLFKRRR